MLMNPVKAVTMTTRPKSSGARSRAITAVEPIVKNSVITCPLTVLMPPLTDCVFRSAFKCPLENHFSSYPVIPELLIIDYILLNSPGIFFENKEFFHLDQHTPPLLTSTVSHHLPGQLFSPFFAPGLQYPASLQASNLSLRFQERT